MSNAAGIDHNQVGFFGGLAVVQSESFEQFSYLLAFILVDLAAESSYRKSFHNMV